MKNRVPWYAFRVAFIQIICIFITVVSAGAVEIGPIFLDYYEKLSDSFEIREYAEVIEVFQEIERLWPNPLDRADSDNYAQYAQAMLNLDEGKYSDAEKAFGALPADFRGNEKIEDAPPASGHMAHYAAGLMHEQDASRIRDGSLEKEEKLNEAIASYEAASGILDSAARIRRLKGRDPLPPGTLSFVSGDATVDSITIEWKDEAQRAGYSVKFAPVLIGASAQTIDVTACRATLNHLIPQTSYVFEIRPSDDSLDCLSAAVETKRAPQYESALFSLQKKVNLFRYGAQFRGTPLADLMNRKRTEPAEMNGSRAMVTVSKEFAQPPYGYLMHAVFENRHTGTAQIERLLVLRVDDKCAFAQMESVEVPVMSVATLLTPVDELLIRVYNELGGWPQEGQGSIELYLDGMMVGYVPIAFAQE